MTKRLITAALPYTNSVPHLGNIVGSHLPADIFARYSRLNGSQTIFVGGTDEHGTATEIAAKQFNITPKELCDFFFKLHKQIYEWFDISYDHFSRTSDKINKELTQDIFLQIQKNGYVKQQKISVPYCTNDDLFLADRFIVGTCPHCKYEKAKGDQCESCGQLLDVKLLENVKCALCNQKKITFVKKDHLFLCLDKLQKKLDSWITKNKTWRPTVKAIAKSWLDKGLEPRDITRELAWGIPVPLERFEESVFYCWFDAPIGYISSTKEHTKTWKTYWQTKDSQIYHFVGKDNIPFHTIFFPAMLLADGRYTLPYNTVGLQYLNFERKKFSKSQGHGVFCENLLKTDLSSDYWRFYLSFVIPETKDTEFLWNDFQSRINSELIGNFSNFVNRTLSFIYSKNKGIIPSGKIDTKTKATVTRHVKKILKYFETVELRLALLEILKLSDFGNRYFEQNKPWKTNDPNTLFVCANLVKILSLLIQPYIPKASNEILKTLQCPENNYKKLLSFNLKNHSIKKPQLLFKKLEDEKLESLKKDTSKVTEFFSVPAFDKLDLVVGKVKDVTNHPNADKLYVLTVDIGTEERVIVSGLRDHYTKDKLKGKSIAFLKNLEPANFRGIKSNGMLLAAGNSDDSIVIVLEPNGKPGDKIIRDENQSAPPKKISYDEFKKVKMVTKDKKI